MGFVLIMVGAVRLIQIMQRRNVRVLLHPQAVAVDAAELRQHIRWAVGVRVGCAVMIASTYLL